MSYRDDVDALFERAATLQRELAHAQAELAQRDAELAAARGTWRVPATADRTWLGAYRARLLEAARSRLDALDPESLVLVGAIIEELAVEPAHRPDILDRVRPIVRYIARR